MKRLMKKTISIVCAVALLFTGLAFVPQTVSADDEWYDMVNTWPEPHPLCEVPEGETSLWTQCAGPTTQIKYSCAETLEGFKWNTVANDTSEAAFFKTIDLKDVACVDNGSGLEKPTAGTYYNMHVKLRFTPPSATSAPKMMVETSGGLQNLSLTKWEFNHSKLNPEEDVLEHEIDGVICMAPGADFKFCINYGWLGDKNKGYIRKGILEITEFTLTGDDSWTTAESNKDVSIPDTPWSVRANYNDDPDAGSYGIIQYKVGDDPTDISDTSMRLVSTVGEQEKYPADYPDVEKRNQPVDSKDRWWWISAQLPDYATTAGLVPFTYYTGSITFNTDKATAEDCHLFVYIDGKEYPFTLQAGANTLTIPEFMYSGSEEGASSIKFLFDELTAGSIVSVSDVTFTPTGDWTTVPNADPDFTVGPWNMFGNFAGSGNWGVVQYKANKENPETYADYDIKAASVSGWLAWSSFVRLENYCADFLDEGDPYDLTITLNSSKATEPKNDPEALDKLVVLVGNETFKFDLTQGDNTLNIHSDGYVLGEGTNRHEQIMFELDGLVQGTELTIKDIQFDNYDNKGWTNVPNKRQTSVGMWTTLAEWSVTRWSKLAYRPNASGSGLSAYDFKTRRTSKDYTLEASMAWLNDYLATAKDTKGNALDNGDPYAPTITMTAGGLGDSVSNYGKMWVNINGTRFSFDVKKGNNTYDLRQLTGNALVYSDENAQDVEFYFDELEDKSVINISKIEFAPLTEPGEDIPNGEAVSPEGTPWTLYAITNPSSGQYGALKYSIDGNPSDLSSLKLYVKSVSGAFIANATFAHLTDYLNNLKNGQNYKITINVAIDESSVVKRDVPYNKQLRVIVNEQNMDFNIPDTPGATTTLQRVFEYDSSKDKDISFQLDQLLQGTKFSVKSIVIEETTDPTQGPTTVNPTTENPSSVDPTSEGPTGTDTSTAVTSSKNDTTTIIPGKTKIKKIYKKKKSAKKLKLKLKKVKGAKGYQIAVYKSKKKAKKNKKALVKKFVKYKKKIVIKSKKLKKKKKLYVRARAYVLDADKVKVFGKWSPIKKAKIK